MDTETTIDFDLPCRKCDYNLRTLAVTARCPECGFPALRTFMAHQVDPERRIPLQAALPHPLSLRVLSRLLRRNADAVTFVLTAHDFGNRDVRQRAGLRQHPPGINARALCRAIADYALFRYGNRTDALATLRFWHIERSEDVGQIVAALVEGGLLTPAENDSPGDFAGLFTLENLFVDRPTED